MYTAILYKISEADDELLKCRASQAQKGILISQGWSNSIPEIKEKVEIEKKQKDSKKASSKSKSSSKSEEDNKKVLK